MAIGSYEELRWGYSIQIPEVHYNLEASEGCPEGGEYD
jgi:hypothetical protein